jgi:hypothetical protein
MRSVVKVAKWRHLEERTMAKEQTAGQRMIASAKQALAFVQGEEHGCVVHIPDEIDTARIRKKINMRVRIKKSRRNRYMLLST